MKSYIICSFIAIFIIYSIDVKCNDCISWTELEKAFKDVLSERKTQSIDETNKTVEATADELSLDKEQIKRLPSPKGKPLDINMTFHIEDINSISDVAMAFRLDFYYLQEWTAFGDDCTGYKNSLKFRNMSLEEVTKTNKLIITDKDDFELFWLPDIMIANAQEEKQQSDLVNTVLAQIHFSEGEEKKDCHMEYMARVFATVACPMDFHDSPIDSQNCSIDMRSFAFNSEKIQLNWAHIEGKSNPSLNPNLRLLEHDFTVSKSHYLFQIFNESYSTLKIGIIFNRKLANKMVAVYTPSILIVLITFCSFWLGLNTTSERVTIGITALLALVTQFNEVRRSLPPTSYITEIDKWMIMCMLFVSAQLVQCTVVDFVYHHQKHNQKTKQRAQNVVNRFRRLSEMKHKNDFLGFRSRVHKNAEKMIENSKPLSNPKLIQNAFKRKISEGNVTKTNCYSVIINALSSLISVPVHPDKPEYIPLRIDAISRILFPLFLSSICLFYWPLMLLKAF